MATDITSILTQEQHEQIERIKTYDAGCRGAFGQQMGYAYLAGMELNAMKERCKHGEFLKLRETHLPMIPERSATRYMKFQVEVSATASLPKFEDVKLLPDGRLPEKEKEKILKAVHKIADGKTLTELYRDLGVIRDKQAKEHHPRKQLTPEQILAAEREQAEAVLNAMDAQVSMVDDNLAAKDGDLISHIKPSRWKESLRKLRHLSKAIAGLTKRKTQKA